MKIKLAVILTSIIAVSLMFSVYQPTDAIPYYNHDGSIDDNTTKYKVKLMQGKKDY